MVPVPEGDRTMASLWGEAGELGRSVLGRERDPEKSVWPERCRATDPNPVRSLSCGGACLGVGCFCVSNEEPARASECECRRLLKTSHFPSPESPPEDLFSKQRWKHGLLTVNNSPPPPSPAPPRWYSSSAPFRVRPPAWGPGLRADLKRVWGLDPLEATPGVGDRLCGQRAEENQPARLPEAPFTRSAPGAQAFPSGRTPSWPPSPRDHRKYPSPSSGSACEIAAE